jgi:hypothetical protein
MWPKSQSYFVKLWASRLVTRIIRRQEDDPTKRQERQCVSQEAVRQSGGSGQTVKGPTWQAAYSHTWLNRDNGGCSLQPSLLPTGKALVPEIPEPPLESRLDWEAARG